jgi:hypothetical protein
MLTYGHHPPAQKLRGAKLRGAVILPGATVFRGRKNTQIYINKQAKKM